MNGDEIFALVVLILLALAGCFGIFVKVKDWLSRDESSEEWDDFDEYLDYLPIVKEILKDAKPCEVFEPDPEIARLRKETQRMALTLKKRLLRRTGEERKHSRPCSLPRSVPFASYQAGRGGAG